jgi:hypothetical protein
MIIAISALLILPVCTLLVLSRVTRDRIVGSEEDGERITRLHFARGLAVVCSLTPPTKMIWDELPKRSRGNLGPFLGAFLVLVGVLGSMAAIVLLILSARGPERVVGPLACLLAVMMCLFLAWAGVAGV